MSDWEKFQTFMMRWRQEHTERASDDALLTVYEKQFNTCREMVAEGNGDARPGSRQNALRA
jgi:hypothetical protein